MEKSKISIIMGSKSDWPTMKHASEMLDKLNIKHEVKVVSAHRTCLLYTSPSPRDAHESRMPSSA